jgi:mannose-6-phosphate isomerase-like protein (cupin superfamily)
MTTLPTSITPVGEPYVAHQPELLWYGDSLFEFLVPAEASGGTITVFRSLMPEGFSPPRHFHTREDEVFMVLEGDVAFDIDGSRRLAGPGTTVYMPRGVRHTFRIESPVARLLGIMTPGHFEEIFRRLGVPAERRELPPRGTTPLHIPTVMAEQTRLGTQVVGPPMGPEDAR